MRILLHGWGSRGDVAPLVALAHELQRRGHAPVIAAARDFEGWIGAEGIGYTPFDVDLGAVSRTDVGRAWLGGESRGMLAENRRMRDFLALVTEPVAHALVDTSEAVDVVVTTPALMTPLLHLPHLRARAAVALFQPALVTRSGESFIAAVTEETSWRNAAVGAGLSVLFNGVVGPITSAVRRLAGVPRVGPLDQVRLTRALPFLLGTSPVVTPPAPDWPVPVTVTGFWREASAPWEPDAALAAFLTAGERPVYLGFGSMSANDSTATARLVRDGVARAGVRAVVLRGTADLDIDDERIHVIDSAPFDRLFPLMSAVVHHGGCGTTHTALHAGVPQFVVPHMSDQPYFGRRMHALGVAPPPVPRRALTAQALARGIRGALEPSRGAAATHLAELVRHEDGVARACDSLERSFG